MPSPTSITLSSTPPSSPLRCAYVTFLLTSPSYLPGILLLAHTLRRPTTSPNTPSAYPLIVAVNPALLQECVRALEEADVQVRVVEPLVPVGKVTTIAERFVDTWTKLRVWEMTEYDVSLPFASWPRKERGAGGERRRAPLGSPLEWSGTRFEVIVGWLRPGTLSPSIRGTDL